MKKWLSILLAVCMVLIACGCGREAGEPREWTRQGYYQNENGYILSVTWMEDIEEPGWYVGCLLGEDWVEDSYGGTLPQEGNDLRGALPSSGSKGDLTVTVSEEGEDGLLLKVEGGETYHFTKMEMEKATIFVSVNTEGWGNIAYTQGEETPEIDPEYPFQSAAINLAEAEIHTFLAYPREGSVFVKWTKNGEDFSTEPQITVLLDETADYVAVFEEEQSGLTSGIDYLALVNKCNALPDGWEDALDTVVITNSVGDEVEVEARAYEAYLALKKDLEDNDGIYLELDSARRSIAEQQDIMDRFIEKYGADYAAKTVAQPGYSEHHTGLALDLYFRVKDESGNFADVYYNEEMEREEYKGIWDKIHEKLPEYGFILRYLEGMEHITGYRYEPWHLRYVDDVDIAREIMQEPAMTLEEYLAGERAPRVDINLKGSRIYSEEELTDAMLAVKCKFAAWDGCQLQAIRYAGDGADNSGDLELLMDFHTAPDIQGSWEPDTDYKDYEWWLSRNEDGDWEIVSWGY